jgi:Glycosyltransferase family 87
LLTMRSGPAEPPATTVAGDSSADGTDTTSEQPTREAPEPSRRSRWSRLVVPALVLVGYLVLAAVLFRGWRLAPVTDTLARGSGEVPFYTWALRWVPFALGQGVNPFGTGYLNAPDGVNLMWNTSLFLPALLLAPVTLQWGPVLTYNILLTVAVGGSAWTAYLAIRRFVRTELAAVAGGLVYGFSPYMRAESLGHVNLTLALFPPLLLLLVHDILVRQHRRAWVQGGLLGLLAAAQLLTSEEVLATSAVTSVVLLLLLLVSFPTKIRSHAPHALSAFAVAAVVCGVVVAAPLWYQFTGPYRYYGAASGVADRYVNDLYTFVVPSQQVLSTPASVERAARLPGNAAERTGYLGVPLLLLVICVAVAWRSRPHVRLAALAGLATAVLSMGAVLYVGGHRTGVPLPWAALSHLPLFESIIASRFALYTALFAGLLVAVFLDEVRSWRWPALGVALAVLALAPLVPKQVGAGMGPVRIPEFFDGSAVESVPRGSVALVVPFPDPSVTVPMLWHAAGGIRFKMVGGYFLGPDERGRARFGPPASTTRSALRQLTAGTATADTLDRRLCPAVRTELARWQVRTVLVGPTENREQIVRFFTLLFDRAPAQAGGMEIWPDVDTGGGCR